MKGVLFRFLHFDIHVPNDLKERFSELCLLFIMDTISEETISRHMEVRERQFRKLESFGGHVGRKDLVVHAPVEVVPQSQPESNHHS